MFHDDPVEGVGHYCEMGIGEITYNTVFFSIWKKKNNGFLDLWTGDIQYTVALEHECGTTSIFAEIVGAQDDIVSSLANSHEKV